MNETRWMGLDVGHVRIGIALSDSMRVMAQPFRVVPRRGDRVTIENILEIAGENAVDCIVVGVPLARDGSRGPMAQRTAQFARALRAATEIKVVEWDERFSTKQAKRALLQGNVRRKKRKESVDKTAAALILQNYLDAQRAGPPDPEHRDYLGWAMESGDDDS
jgi:putative Holliday junction resolvase